jgi:osmotically-inducible protein OsmY
MEAPMRRSAISLLATFFFGCTTIAQTGYEAATDERPLAGQKTGTGITLTIQKDLLASDVKDTGGLDVFGRNGVVVLAGVVEPGSQAGTEAVRIARAWKA